MKFTYRDSFITKFSLLTITSFFFFVLSVMGSQALAGNAQVTGKVVNIRSGPGTSYEVVGTLTQGTEITVSQQQGDWSQITTGSTSGWISNSYIAFTQKIIVTGEVVNLRSGPDTSHPKIGEVKKGDQLTLIGIQNEWYQVKTTDNQEAFISAALASVGSSAASTATSAPASGRQVEVISGPVNTRTGPGSNYDLVQQINNGTYFSVIGQDGEWLKIDLGNGKESWVAGWLVQEVSHISSNNSSTVSSTGANQSPVVYLDGTKLDFEVEPIIENDRTLVPLRAIFEAMGAAVDWNQQTRTVTAAKEGTTVILPLGSTSPSVNGNTWPLDIAAKIVQDRTLAPLRFVGEAFGGQVIWNSTNRTINITSPAPAPNNGDNDGISPEKATKVTVASGTVNLRSGPNTTYAKVAEAQTGERLDIVDEKDGWYQVSRAGVTGWVASWLVQLAWEEEQEQIPEITPENPPDATPANPPEVTPVTPTTPVITSPSAPVETKKPGKDVIWLSMIKDGEGLKIIMESGARLDTKITEKATEITYNIKDRKIEGISTVSDLVGDKTVKASAGNLGTDVQVVITMPSGVNYYTSTEDGGSKEILTIPNYIINIERKPFGGNGERIIVTTAIPVVTPSAIQRNDLLEIKLNHTFKNSAQDEYRYTDSTLLKTIKVTEQENGAATSTLLAIDTTNIGKFSFGEGLSPTEFNIMIVTSSGVVRLQENLVVLDPGHGGSDTGARGGQTNEAIVNMQIAFKVGEILEQQGIQVVYTRESNVYVGLEERADIANKLNATLFVSVHNNANTDPTKQGTETYYYAPASNPELFMQKDERERLATHIQNQMAYRLNRSDRGVKQSNFSVLRNTIMPSALAEVVFISNPEEESLLLTQAFRDQAAEAIASGILRYLGK